MGKSLYAEVYHRAQCQIHDEHMEAFKAINIRHPTLEEESTIFLAIPQEHVLQRMNKLLGRPLNEPLDLLKLA